MTWILWLLLLVVAGVVIAMLQGIVAAVFAFVEEQILEPRRLRRREAEKRLHAGGPRPATSDADAAGPTAAGTSPKSGTRPAHPHGHPHPHADKPVVHLPVKPAAPPRPPTRFGRWVKRLKLSLSKKGFDHWVAAAIAEDDPQMKLDYLSKALKLNPTYVPTWGMKGSRWWPWGDTPRRSSASTGRWSFTPSPWSGIRRATAATISASATRPWPVSTRPWRPAPRTTTTSATASSA